MNSIWMDVRLGCRTLLKAPLFTIAVVPYLPLSMPPAEDGKNMTTKRDEHSLHVIGRLKLGLGRAPGPGGSARARDAARV